VNRDLLRDLSAALAAALLVTTAAVVGTFLEHRYGNLHVSWPPLYGHWEPHLGPGTPAAILVAVAVVAYGPSLAARLPWRALLWSAWGTAMAWTFSLALVDGWQRGIAVRLTTKYEYLQVIAPVNRFDDLSAALREFTHHILIDSPGAWPAHVAGHPPAATLTFVLLDRIGLGGGAWAGVWCITVGATAAAAILVAVRVLCGEELARRAAPFLVLAPAAVWMGTSADGYFAAVAAWAVAFLALAVTGHRPRTTGTASGLLLGLTVYLSYGLTLFAVIAGGVLLLGSRRLRPLPWVLAGSVVVPVVFTFAGFNWWEAYHLLVTRYYQGAGGIRPYGYWVWANFACAAFLVGPATVAGLRRAGAAPVRRGVRACLRRPAPPEPRLALLVLGALLALLAADLSGMSKAETERIWLPFAMWLLPGCALLTRPRAWLAAQAVLALLLNHLLLTGW
jgi:methylthioxylose transferase